MTPSKAESAPVFADSPCACYTPAPGRPCVCLQEERALRNHSGGAIIPPMTPEQREWCKQQIVAVEGYSEKDAEGSDSDVARTVLSAWTDYCRDKGLM